MEATNQGEEKPRTTPRSNLAELITTEPVVHKKASSRLRLTVDDEEKNDTTPPTSNTDVQEYRLYKRRWLGLVGMVVLNIVAAMNWIWFSPIANSSADTFHISLSQVNWLGQVVNLVYLPMALLIPTLVNKFGIRKTCIAAAICLLFASWIRYAGVSKSLSKDGAYALLIVGQIFAGLAQPVFQVLGPAFSETWFDLKSRTTATMVIAVANPVGSALGQLLPPFMSDPRASLLVLAIATSVCLGTVLLIQEAPPTPPTFAGSTRSPPFIPTILALITGRKSTIGKNELEFTKTERIDFAILSLVFGLIVAGVSSFSILINQIFAPAGYSDETSGFIGAALLLTGLLAGLITSPLFDRVLTHHLSPTIKICLPPMAGCWIGLIFAVKPHNEAAIYVVSSLIGIIGFLLLPVALELGVEITRCAEISSAILWMSANFWTLVFVLVADALRDKKPPYSMKKALIFFASFISAGCLFVWKFTGEQTRRKMDLDKNREANNVHAL